MFFHSIYLGWKKNSDRFFKAIDKVYNFIYN